MMKNCPFLPALVLTVAAVTMTGCGKTASPAARAAVVKAVEARPAASQVATLDPALEVAPRTSVNVGGGGELMQTALTDTGSGAEITARKIWVYRPYAARTGPVRCVVMAPAGSHFFDGMGLSEGDAPEHLNYLANGVAVIACEVDGALPEKQDDLTMAAAARAAKQFMASKAGIRNTQAAIDIAESLPWVDKKHIYVSGHSSAATLALQTAAFDKRVAGCIAFAPEVNVPAFVDAAGQVEAAGAPGLQATLDALSPHNNISRMTGPIFLFCAEDDTVIHPADVKAYAAQVQKINKAVVLQTVPSGGHYDSMMKTGIPAASAWLLKQP